ncbi:MAG TPA: class I SAM-dependent methyltransferase [Candidatus Paceibacterota bacterium]
MDRFSEDDWGTYAGNYDILLSLTPYRHMLEDVARLIGSRDRKTGCVLDAGCGTGNLIHTVLSAGYIGNITGIDMSDAMLAIACKKNAGARFLRADLNATLPFGRSTIETIVCVNALYAVRDPKRTLVEFGRLLAPQGMLIIVTPKHGYQNGLILKKHCQSDRPDSYWADAHSSRERERLLIHEALRDEETARRMMLIADVNRNIALTSHFHFFTREDVGRVVTDAGLVVTHHSMTYAHQSHLIVATKDRSEG